MRSKMSPSSLSGKVAIVTGSGRGLGAATAIRFAELGADVVVNDLGGDTAKEVAAKITALGRKALVSTHDVSNHAAATELAAEAKSKLGRVDILVNNAGILRDALLAKMAESQWDDVIRVNLKGPFNMGQACAKHMIEQKSGRILNIASVAWLGNVGQTNYSAAKAGVVGLTRTWALELARYGITVNAIAPGMIDSVMSRSVPKEIMDKFLNRIPLKRIGQPDDIASLLSFLASDQASYITGQCIQIDGGLSVGISS
jgi:NAD(P)-dependent dehydrogenase (short-subunit alcohol dehydrogenase family)